MRKLSQKNSRFVQNFLKSKDTFEDVLDEDKLIKDIAEKDLLNGEKFYQSYQDRKNNLPWYVKLYIHLRRSSVNPILLVNDRNRIKNMQLEACKGEVQVKSSIEQAIINDLKQENVTGEPTDY